MTPIKGLVALVLALAPAVAAAGKRIQVSAPPTGRPSIRRPRERSRLIGRFELVPVPSPARRAREAERGAARNPDELARQRVQDLEAADAAIKEPEQSLEEALERQQAGVEPWRERLATSAARTSRSVRNTSSASRPWPPRSPRRAPSRPRLRMRTSCASRFLLASARRGKLS